MSRHIPCWCSRQMSDHVGRSAALTAGFGKPYCQRAWVVLASLWSARGPFCPALSNQHRVPTPHHLKPFASTPHAAPTTRYTCRRAVTICDYTTDRDTPQHPVQSLETVARKYPPLGVTRGIGRPKRHGGVADKGFSSKTTGIIPSTTTRTT